MQGSEGGSAQGIASRVKAAAAVAVTDSSASAAAAVAGRQAAPSPAAEDSVAAAAVADESVTAPDPKVAPQTAAAAVAAAVAVAGLGTELWQCLQRAAVAAGDPRLAAAAAAAGHPWPVADERPRQLSWLPLTAGAAHPIRAPVWGPTPAPSAAAVAAAPWPAAAAGGGVAGGSVPALEPAGAADPWPVAAAAAVLCRTVRLPDCQTLQPWQQPQTPLATEAAWKADQRRWPAARP